MGIDFTKYPITGWTLSEQALTTISNILFDGIRVIEFGSGVSTQFLLDMGVFDLISLDNDIGYAHPHATIVPLMECSDIEFDNMFTSKEYNLSKFTTKVSVSTTRQKNCMYDFSTVSLNGIYDLVVLDGPNGNGRSLAYIALQEFVHSGTYILVDDYDHYDFIERAQQIFDVDIVMKYIHDKDRVALLKIK